MRPTSTELANVYLDIVIVASTFLLALGLATVAELGYPGPLSVVVALLALAWVLRRRGESWQRLLGATPVSWWGATIGVAGMALGALVVPSLVFSIALPLGLPAPSMNDLAMVRGNTPALFGLLAIAWTTAAVGEELLFRGFLIDRLTRAWGGGRVAATGAVGAQALLFGVAHANQGVGGVVATALVALVLGLGFLVLNRRLVPVMVAHGLVDSVGAIALFAGAAPDG